MNWEERSIKTVGEQQGDCSGGSQGSLLSASCSGFHQTHETRRDRRIWSSRCPERSNQHHPPRTRQTRCRRSRQRKRMLPLSDLPSSKPLRGLAPSVRLKREDEDVWVVDILSLFRHSNTVEPTKHIAFGCEPDNAMFGLPCSLSKRPGW